MGPAWYGACNTEGEGVNYRDPLRDSTEMFVFSGEQGFSLTAYRQERKFSTSSAGGSIVTRWGLINHFQPERENSGSHLPKHELQQIFWA
jgi:hypothetical protein